MPTSDIQAGSPASAQVFQDAFASYLMMLNDLPDTEVVPVASGAAKNLVVLISERESSPTVRTALVEISTLCQQLMIAVERPFEPTFK